MQESGRQQKDLTGTVCVVAGAGKGIGHAVAIRLAAGGATVVAADNDRASAEATLRCVPAAAYTASKHDLIGLTRNIAWMCADRGIRACALSPGGIRTGISMGGGFSEFGLQRVRAAGPKNMHIGQPEEIAELVSTLSRAETSLINGAVLAADQGWKAN